MQPKQIYDKLNRARRALDSLSQVSIINEWKFDDELKVWYLQLGIVIEDETLYFPSNSQWYVVVESDYPKGTIKIYPAVNKSITVTLYHQANNSRIVKNGLWRTGALCLEINSIYKYQSEPESIDDRLLYHVKRAVFWLKLAAKGKLVMPDEPFEQPYFINSYIQSMRFAFSEDIITYMQWESVECKYGIAELDVYKSQPFVYYVKTFKSLCGRKIHTTQWGEYLSKRTVSPPIIAPWILLNQLPVINEWQAPHTFGDLLDACKIQNFNFLDVFREVISKVRDGNRHLLLLGFSVPQKFGGEPEIIFWKALYLPVVSCVNRTAKGFRNNQKGWWRRDMCEVFKRSKNIDWIVSENWNQQEISQRGKMNELLLRKRVLLIGVGCIGASIAEIYVRAGIYNLTIVDYDEFEVGNLSRHTLDLSNVGDSKVFSLCKHLNSLNPHASVKMINGKFSNDISNKANVDLNKYDIIIDCTGENGVLEIIKNTEFMREHMLASVSVGLGAKRLYMALMSGRTFDFKNFFNLVSPYLQNEKELYDNFDLPRNGIGCWHPTFPGRSDDIWLAAATFVKAFENYILSKPQKAVSLVYEQRYSSQIFEGFKIVEQREDE